MLLLLNSGPEASGVPGPPSNSTSGCSGAGAAAPAPQPTHNASPPLPGHQALHLKLAARA